MIPAFYETTNIPEIHHERVRHVSPHLHSAIECVLVTEGSLEIGQGSELFHMEAGDFAMIFPNAIHHYQHFVEEEGKAYFLLMPPTMYEPFAGVLESKLPVDPVIPAARLNKDIETGMLGIWRTALKNNIAMFRGRPENMVPYAESLYFGYAQLILARALAAYELIDRDSRLPDDEVMAEVRYISTHITENITLEEMAHDLGMNPYSMSRLFSATFHVNMNTYINSKRLDMAAAALQYSNRSITEIYEDCGFQSARTFNRVFSERYHMSPRDYRNMCREQAAKKIDEWGKQNE